MLTWTQTWTVYMRSMMLWRTEKLKLRPFCYVDFNSLFQSNQVLIWWFPTMITFHKMHGLSWQKHLLLCPSSFQHKKLWVVTIPLKETRSTWQRLYRPVPDVMYQESVPGQSLWFYEGQSQPVKIQDIQSTADFCTTHNREHH